MLKTVSWSADVPSAWVINAGKMSALQHFAKINNMQFNVRIFKSSHFWLVLLIIGTLLLAYLSLFHAPTIKIGPDVRNRVVHFIAYFVYGATLAFWRLTLRPPDSLMRVFVGSFLPASAYGLLLEWLQMYLPLRDSDPFDGLCNVLGALAGVSVSFLFRHLIRDSPKDSP